MAAACSGSPSRSMPPPSRRSEGVILGRVTNGGGRTIRLLRPPTAEPAAQTQVAEDGSYRFDKLAAGAYTVQVLEGAPGSTVVVERADVVVDGSSEVVVDLALSQPQPQPEPQPQPTPRASAGRWKMAANNPDHRWCAAGSSAEQAGLSVCGRGAGAASPRWQGASPSTDRTPASFPRWEPASTLLSWRNRPLMAAPRRPCVPR